MKTHKNDEQILTEDIKAIFDEKVIHIVQVFEYDEPMTFGDILGKCIDNGYEVGTILLITESHLDGTIYRYGNYGDDLWYEVGNMVGFA